MDDLAIFVMRRKTHRVIASRATIAPELHRNCPHIDIAIAVYNKVEFSPSMSAFYNAYLHLRTVFIF